MSRAPRCQGVGPGPLEQHEEPVPKADQEHDVHEQPGEPGGQAGELEAAMSATRRRGRWWPCCPCRGRRTAGRLPGEAAPHVGRGRLPLLHRHRGEAGERVSVRLGSATESPMANASGCPGIERSGSTMTRPARSSGTPSERVSGEAATPAAHSTVRERICSPPSQTASGVTLRDGRAGAHLDAEAGEGVGRVRESGSGNAASSRGRPRAGGSAPRRIDGRKSRARSRARSRRARRRARRRWGRRRRRRR